MSSTFSSELVDKFYFISDISSFREIFKEKKEVYKSGNLSIGDKAEFEMWLLFSQLKPLAISKNNIPIKLKSGKSYEIDVLAVFEEAIFVIESKEGKAHYPQKHIS